VLGALSGVAVLVAAATLPVLFGYHTYVVEGGSMGSSLKAGSVAVSKPTSPYALEIGDIIARRSSPDSPPVLHRIVDITVEDGQRLFTTQGDVNRTPDPQPVAFDGQGDKVVYSVPYAGYILHYVGSGLGRLLLIGAPLALLAATVLRDKWRRPRQRKGSGTGTAAEEGAEETLPLDTTPPPEEEEAPREAAAALIEPPSPWRRLAPLLLVPFAIALGLALAQRGNGSPGRHQPMRLS
jgi:signal peptidase